MDIREAKQYVENDYTDCEIERFMVNVGRDGRILVINESRCILFINGLQFPVKGLDQVKSAAKSVRGGKWITFPRFDCKDNVILLGELTFGEFKTFIDAASV